MGYGIHGEEPVGELGARLVKDRTGARVNLMTAPLTGIGAALADQRGLGRRAAAGAVELGAAYWTFYDGVETGVIGRNVRPETV